jgi:tRNA nucleotidyltransferase/poly(A) polymerase
MDVYRIAKHFSDSGESFYLVGGYARDAIMGKIPKDIDVATTAVPERTKALLREIMGKGDAMYTVGEKYGTIGAVIGGMEIEITTYRTEVYAEDSRHPEVAYGTSLKEDLARRDFTMNAIAIDPLTGESIDYFGGEEDIEKKVVRAVGDPSERIFEDSLRMMRAVRFCAKYGFKLDPALRKAIKKHRARLKTISTERVTDELSKILLSDRPEYGMKLLDELGLIASIAKGRKALPHAVEDISVRLALVADAEKYRYPTKVVREAKVLERVEAPKDLEDVTVRRFIRGLHDAGIDVGRAMSVIRARTIAEGGHLYDFGRLVEKIAVIESEVDVREIESPLSGEDIIRILGIKPGPVVGKVKKYLTDKAVDGTLGDPVKEMKAFIKKG